MRSLKYGNTHWMKFKQDGNLDLTWEAKVVVRQMMIDLRKDLVQELDEKFYNGREEDEDQLSKLKIEEMM